MRVIVIDPPAPIVTYEQAVARLNLDADADEKADIEQMIAAATASLDGPGGWLGRALGPQTLEARFDGFDVCRGGSIFLPYRPIIEVISVRYVDGASVEQTVDPADWEDLGHEVIPAYQRTWPTARAGRETVRVRYLAGYNVVPAQVPAAILLMVGHIYAHRTDPNVLVPQAEALLGPLRVYQ